LATEVADYARREEISHYML